MTTTYHSAIATGAAANASVVNAPLGQLDAALVTVAAQAQAAIDAALTAGTAVTLADGAANAAQKVVTVDDSSIFTPGCLVEYTLVGGVLETNTVDTVDDATQITLVTNIGTGGIPDNGPVTVMPKALYNARAGRYNVLDYGAVGDGATDDTAAIVAAITAAQNATPAGRVVLPNGVYAISGPVTLSADGVALLGESGWAKATLLCTTADSGVVVQKAASAAIYQVEIGNLYISGDGVAATGLHLINASECNIHDVLIIETTDYAIRIGTGVAQGIHTFDRVAMNQDATDAVGVYIETLATAWFRNCNFFGGTEAFKFDGSSSNLQITQCWFEAWETILSFDHTAAAQSHYNIVLRDSYLLSTKGGGTYDARIVKCLTDNNTYAGDYRNIAVENCYIATTAAKYVIEIDWNTGVGGGSSRFTGSLANCFFNGSNCTAWLYSEPANTFTEFVRVVVHNPMTAGAALPVQDGTTRAYVRTLLPAFGTAAPADNAWLQGDIVWNSDPDAGDFIGWVCVAAGSPGTWKGFGLIDS